MKILLTSGIYPPDVGGPATFIPVFSKYLVDNGFEVTTITLTDHQGSTIVTPDGVVIKISRKLPIGIRQIFTTIVIMRNIRNHDVVFSNGLFLEAAVSLKFFKRKSVAKIVGDPVWEKYCNRNGMKDSIESFQEIRVGFRYKWLRKLFNFAYKQFDILTAPGPGIVGVIDRWDLGKNVIHIANGVKCLSPKEVPQQFDVLSLSRLVTWKNLELVIEACKIAGISLGVAGVGPEMENLQGLSKKLDVNVKFLGNLAGPEIEEFLNSGRIFVLVSDYEGLSFSLLQAMMLGKRIVVSDNPGNASVITNDYSGKILKEKDPEALAAILLELLENRDVNISLEQNAREIALVNFCQENQLSKFEQLLRIE